MRRHLTSLVEAGLIVRHDSPNGKRYAARDQAGAIVRAFRFVLRPLLVRAEEIGETARAVRAAAERCRALRERSVLMLRDAAKLLAFAEGPRSPVTGPIVPIEWTG